MTRDEIRVSLNKMMEELSEIEKDEELSVPEEHWVFFIKDQIKQFIDSLNFHDIMKGRK